MTRIRKPWMLGFALLGGVLAGRLCLAVLAPPRPAAPARERASLAAPADGDPGTYAPAGTPPLLGPGEAPATGSAATGLNAPQLKAALAAREASVPRGGFVQSAAAVAGGAQGSRVASLDAAARALLEFDPKVASAFFVKQLDLMGGETADRCASQAIAASDGYFVLKALVMLDLECKAGRCAIAAAQLGSDGDDSELGPEAFGPCYTGALVDRGFDCAGCREGKVAVNWPVHRAHLRDQVAAAPVMGAGAASKPGN